MATSPRLRFKAKRSSSASASLILTDLPCELLERILGYLPLKSLDGARSVCWRFHELIDFQCASRLWRRAPLGGLWLAPENRGLVMKACEYDNVEATIMLAFAYLYAEGTPLEKDRVEMLNVVGDRTASILLKLEGLMPSSQPFAWVLIRPPWAKSCLKESTWRCLQACCSDSSDRKAVGRIYYSVGRAVGFLRAAYSEAVLAASEVDPMPWFESGAELDCPYASLELWKVQHKPELSSVEYTHPIRLLRQLVFQCHQLDATHRPGYYCEAQFELCLAYARGFYGGFSKEEALRFIRQTFTSSVPSSRQCSVALATNSILPRERRYILVDWLLEVATLKELPPSVLHMAISLTDLFLKHQRVERCQLQLLGITAILLASRWIGESILSIREATWFTDNTYSYDQVVRMMGHIVASLHGDIRRTTVYDYLLVLFALLPSSSSVEQMATYLSEAILLHTVFASFTAAKMAVSCLLSARVVCGLEYPWPNEAEQATGFELHELKDCCITVYERCLTSKYDVIDQRNVKLDAIYERHTINNNDVMHFDQFTANLGVTLPAVPLITPASKLLARTTPKPLSFLSDGSYLAASPSNSPISSSDSGYSARSTSSSSRSSNGRPDQDTSLESSPHSSQACFQSPEPAINLNNLSLQSSTSTLYSSDDTGGCPSSRPDFPQPSFSDCELSPSPLDKVVHRKSVLEEEALDSDSHSDEYPMEIEETATVLSTCPSSSSEMEGDESSTIVNIDIISCPLAVRHNEDPRPLCFIRRSLAENLPPGMRATGLGGPLVGPNPPPRTALQRVENIRRPTPFASSTPQKAASFTKTKQQQQQQPGQSQTEEDKD